MSPNSIRNGIALLAIMLLPAAALASADVTPPVLVSAAFAPTAVDVSNAEQTVSATVAASDDSSGVEYIDLDFLSPSGNSGFNINLEAFNLVSGTPLDGVFCSTNALETCAEPGTWTLQEIIIEDNCGNQTIYQAKASGSVLAFPAGTQTTIVVTNTNAVPAAPPRPVITSFTFSPATVSLSTTNTLVTGTATITGSNIETADFNFSSPSGNQTVYGDFYVSTPPAPGTTGTYTATFSFGTCDVGGKWTLSSLSASSPTYESCQSESGTNYAGAALAAIATSGTSIMVSNTNASLTPPVLVGLGLSATSVDVTNGETMLSGSVIATDSASGLESADATYTDSSGTPFYFDFNTTVGGVILDGTMTGAGYGTTCTPPGTYTLQSIRVYDQCDNEATYTSANFPAGVTGKSFVVINGTLPTGSVAVNILPTLAADYGGSWFLDGTNDYYYSQDVITGVSPGQHTVYFNDATGYTTPASQTVTVVANQPTYITGTYVSTTPSDSVQTFLLPPLVTGSALWNVDNGPLQPSGTIVSTIFEGNPLTDGTHVIEFSGVNGYVAPAAQIVTTANNQTTVTTGTYAEVTGSGSLTVTLGPPGAIKDGAMWNVDGGLSQASGATVSGLIATGHIVNFTGGGTSYSAPASQNVSIAVNALTSATGTYTPLSTGAGSLTVTITPGTVGDWYLDGDTSVTHKGGTTVGGISGGVHTVSFTMAGGYITPASQGVTIFPDETVSASGTYTKAPPFVGSAALFEGISLSGNGLLTLNLTDTGKFTGKLVTANGKTFALTGSLNSMGYFSGTAGKPPVQYVLQVTGSTPGTYVLTGSSGGSEITAYPGATVAETGTYTALLTGTDTSAAIPQGTGYGTLKFSKTGVGTFKGKLADGTAFTASGIVVAGIAGNQFIVFDPNIYAKKGLLSGVLTFGVPATGELEGALSWVKPAGKGTRYAAGFDTTLDAMGALYVANKTMPVPFTSGTISFGGVSGISLSQPFTVSGTVVDSGTNTVKISIKATTGALSGTFKPVAGKPAIAFSGLLLQDPNDPNNTIGAGYFLSPVISGTSYSGGVTLP